MITVEVKFKPESKAAAVREVLKELGADCLAKKVKGEVWKRWRIHVLDSLISTEKRRMRGRAVTLGEVVAQVDPRPSVKAPANLGFREEAPPKLTLSLLEGISKLAEEAGGVDKLVETIEWLRTLRRK